LSWHPLLRCPLLLIGLFGAGCEYQATGGIDLSAQFTAPSVLISEVRTAEDRAALVFCPIEIRNTAGEPRTVVLQKTGCSCYGVIENGQRLETGSELTVPPGGQLQLQLNAMPPEMESSKEYTADFEIPEPTGSRRVTFHCQLRTYLDLRVTPAAITVEKQPGLPSEDVREVLVEYTCRNQVPATVQPEIRGLPPDVTVTSVSALGDPEELEAGIFRKAWAVTLRSQIAADVTDEVPPVPLTVTIADPAGTVLASAPATWRLYLARAVNFPSRVHFGSLPVGETRSRRILLSSVDGQPFQLQLDPAGKPAFLNVTLPPTAEAQQWLELDVTPDLPGTFSGVLRLQSDRPSQPTIEIQVEGTATAE
jgi:hypothetical protein